MKYAVWLKIAINAGKSRFDDVGPPVTREPWTPVPATVVIMPVLFVIFRITLEEESATKRFPDASKAIPVGELIVANVARPPSPE